MNVYIVFEIDLWAYTQGANFTLGYSLFGVVKLTRNADFHQHKYSGYAIGFDTCESVSLSDGSGFGKNLIIFGADISSSVHVDNRKRDILILGIGFKQG